MTSSFFVLRHSERIDESHPKEWEEIIKRTYGGLLTSGKKIDAVESRKPSSIRTLTQPTGSNGIKLPHIPHRRESSSLTTSPRLPSVLNDSKRSSSVPISAKRNQKYFASDPPLSSINGPHYAQQAAETIARMIDQLQTQSQSINSIKIYCSRLRRAVQTAAPLARRIGVPIYLSYGLSTIIGAVKRANGNFEFQSSEELAEEFPGITFINCDLREDVAHYLPTNVWTDSIHTILQRSTANELIVIVGHRETIRGVAGEHMTTPYCAIGIFDRSPLSVRNDEETNNPYPPPVASRRPEIKKAKPREGPLYRLERLLNCEGRQLLPKTPS